MCVPAQSPPGEMESLGGLPFSCGTRERLRVPARPVTVTTCVTVNVKRLS